MSSEPAVGRFGLPRTRPTKGRRRPTRIPTGTVPRRRLRAESSLAGPRRRRATHVSATARHPPPGSTRPTLESVKQVSGATGMIAEADIAPATDVPALADLPDTQVPACVVAQAVCAVGRGRERARAEPRRTRVPFLQRNAARSRPASRSGIARCVSSPSNAPWGSRLGLTPCCSHPGPPRRAVLVPGGRRRGPSLSLLSRCWRDRLRGERSLAPGRGAAQRDGRAQAQRRPGHRHGPRLRQGAPSRAFVNPSAPASPEARHSLARRRAGSLGRLPWSSFLAAPPARADDVRPSATRRASPRLARAAAASLGRAAQSLLVVKGNDTFLDLTAKQVGRGMGLPPSAVRPAVAVVASRNPRRRAG